MKTLQRLKPKQSLFNDFYVFDVETNGLRAKSDAFIFGVIYGFNFIKVLYSVDDFKKEFENERYKKKKVFAHNAEYDLSVIYDNIYDFDSKAIFNNRFIYATNGNAQFADSFNIYATSVKEIGKLINLQKLEIEDEYKEGEFKGKVTQRMIDYCIRDCEIIYKALYEIFNDCGTIKITIAGLSMEYYRRFYQPFNIDYNEHVKEFYASYFGGRTECFFIGKKKGYCYDINSMYPYAMVNAFFPNPRNLKKEYGISVKRFINHYLKYYEGCAELELFHVEHYYGFLPVRHEGKLIFPTGHLKGTWNFNELRFALKNKIIQIKRVKSITYAPRMKSIFKSYVENQYNERKMAVSPLKREILKKRLNTLYGKFAQRIKSEMIYIHDINEQYDEVKRYMSERKLLKIHPFSASRADCFIEIKSARGGVYHSIPVFSSYITSFARVYLLEFLLKYQQNEPLYCDTDSIFLAKDPKILESNELGAWKKEDKVITEIRGLKNYSYISEGKIKDKIKGIPRKAEKTGDVYRYKTLVKTKESMRRNIESGIEIEREKILKLTYDKRKVDKSGNTRPLCFET